MAAASAPAEPGRGDDGAPKGKVVLAYSGGLDTTVIASWLMERGWEVVAFTADLGQGEELEEARATAAGLGIADIRIEDLRQRFAQQFVLPMLRANPLYEGEYLLGTAIARPLVAQRLVEIARETGAAAVAHGATGKGNDQVRFEIGVRALEPSLQVIAPWRTWDFVSRDDLVAYCRSRQLPVQVQPSGKSTWSMDANLWHISYEGGELEDPAAPPPDTMWRWTQDPLRAPGQPQELEIGFADGDPVSLDGAQLPPHELIASLNAAAGAHGVGRVDMVENRMVGMKSRGCYETPAGTVLLKARRALESIALDGHLAHLKDELMPRYADLVYQGLWFAPEREALQALIDSAAQGVTGQVRVRLYKGGVAVLGRRSPNALYDAEMASFDAEGGYDQADAEGFIRLKSLRLQALRRRDS